jgi:hypothetical protein
LRGWSEREDSHGIAADTAPVSRHLSLAGAAGLFHIPRVVSAEEPPETRTVRLAKNASICA